MATIPAAEDTAPALAPLSPASVEPLSPELERDWDELARATDASPFLRPGYLRLWRATFGDGTVPSVAAARRGPRLVGVTAIVRDRGRIAPPGNFETPSAGIVAADDDAAAAVARGLMSFGARRVDLQPVPADALSRRVFEAAAREAGHRLITRATMRCPVVDTRDGWEPYWSSLSRNLRHKVERCTRRADESGGLSFDVRERFAEDELEDLLLEGFAVEGSGWKTAEGTAILTSPLSRRYYGDLAAWAAREGWLRLAYVRVGGTPVAFGLSVEAFGVHHALKVGYEPAAARLSPGTLLLHGLIRRTFERGLDRFDFAGHLEPYKEAWATGVDDQLTMAAFPPSPAGRLAYRAEAARVALAEGRAAPLLRPAIAAARRVAGAVRARRAQAPSAAGRE